MQDIVHFANQTFRVPTGHTEAEIREALAETAPSIAHAQASRQDNGDGSFTWRFAATAGTKGC